MGNSWVKGFVAVVLGVLLGLAGIAPASSAPGRVEGPVEALVRLTRTPEQLAQFLRENIFFREDLRQFGRVDYWQDPEELLARRQGDCEDYALLAQAVLSRLGLQAFVLSLYGQAGYAHTVCVYVEEGRYNVVNQDRVVRYRARSLEELATRLYSRWDWGAVAERQGHRGRAVREIYNGIEVGRVFH